VNEASFTGQTQEQFSATPGPYLELSNHITAYPLIGGHSMVLAAVYIL
jgi:hypothetical protein